MAHWNFRVIRHEDGSQGIHETFYEGDKIGWSQTPLVIVDAWEIAANPNALREALEFAQQGALDALEKPVLDGEATRS